MSYVLFFILMTFAVGSVIYGLVSVPILRERLKFSIAGTILGLLANAIVGEWGVVIILAFALALFVERYIHFSRL